MTMKPKSETSPPAATPAAPRVVWHLYYQDPAHDIVLISSDNISFRVSVFRLSGASPSFANRKRIEFAVPLFRSYAAKVIGIFLDLCYGRPIAQAGFTDETTFISLLNLFVKTNSHELRRRLFDSGTEVPSRSLAESLRLASTKNDIEWGAQSIHLLTQKLQMDKLQTVEQIRWVMANCSDAWKLVLYDLLLEDRDRPARLVVLRKDWPRVVDEFEKRLKERQAAVMPKQVPPASTQPASNPAAPVKRPAGSEQPSAECRADKVRKTRSC